MVKALLSHVKNETGAEVVEVAIWLALVVAITTGVITKLGSNVQKQFSAISAAL